MCGVVVEEDTLLRLQRVQIEVNRHKETAIACIWVTNGIDHCRIGFLKRHMLKNSWRFDGALTQVTKIFSADPCHCNLADRRMHYHNNGCALAAIVSTVFEGQTSRRLWRGWRGRRKCRWRGQRRKRMSRGRGFFLVLTMQTHRILC